ncbi:hypothetical protein [Amycolatopsis suaedae]|uniref:Uncharacterized protein n=1 Tax=Amycolatopsis suaedae TaxID=2510978 RepID=A0A4Q7J0I2_9PSEU|nr:hypothetical protein [Amycolatopsis suaedae]RZQ60851.1 hypothetical protein EWH70_27515 [Amycolatopsis suaedae]
MSDRLFVPAAFAGLVAGMPSASSAARVRAVWLDRAVEGLRREFAGPRGLVAMRLAGVIDRVRHATYEEIDRGRVSAA